MQSSISGSITNLSEKLHNRPLYLYEVVCKNYPKIKKLQKPIDFFEIRCYNIRVKKICVPPEHIGLSVKRVFVEVVTLTTARSRWFKSNRGSQEKSKSKDLLFSIQSEGLACNLTAGEYVIAEGVWHHASACIFLRIVYIHHSVMIPYKALP